jgi:hypothetical protein
MSVKSRLEALALQRRFTAFFCASSPRIPNRYTLFKHVQPLFRIRPFRQARKSHRTLLALAASRISAGVVRWGLLGAADSAADWERALTGTFRQGRMAPDHAHNACRRHCERLAGQINDGGGGKLAIACQSSAFSQPSERGDQVRPQPHAVQRFADAR